MKNIFKLTKILKLPKRKKKSIIGCIEKQDCSSISGWVIHRQNHAIDFQIRVNGSAYSYQATWKTRLDIAYQHGYEHLHCGFELTLAESLKGAIRKTLSPSDRIEVFANNILLDFGSSNQKAKTFPLKKNKLGIAANFACKIRLELIGHFIIHGYGDDDGNLPKSCYLTGNGFTLICPVVSARTHHHAATKLSKPSVDIAIPGYMWMHVSNRNSCIFNIAFGESQKNSVQIEISRSQSCKWLKEIIAMPESEDKQYLTLLALEHIKYGGFLGDLSENDANYFIYFCKLMNLDNYLNDASDNRTAPVKSTPTPANQLLWQALQALNSRIHDTQTIFKECEAIIEEHRLQGQTLKWYIRSISPLLCKSGEFLDIVDYTKLDEFERLADSQDVWHKTLSLPALVLTGKLSKGMAVIASSAKIMNEGWVNLECLLYALGIVQVQARHHTIDYTELELFNQALMDFIDNLQGEWFSRLHDLNLIDICIGMLAESHVYSDPHKINVIHFALRQYGLNPTFWSRLHNQQHLLEYAALTTCFENFHKIQASFQARFNSSVQTDAINALIEAFIYFKSLGNVDVDIYIRDCCLNLMALQNTLSAHQRVLFKTLFKLNESEALRIAAFPFNLGATAIPEFSETNPQTIYAIISQLSGQKTATSYSLNDIFLKVFEDLEELANCPDQENRKAQFKDIVNKVLQSSSYSSDLTIELQTRIVEYAIINGFDCTAMTDNLITILSETIAKTASKDYLPAIVMASLARLNSFLTQNRHVLRLKLNSLFQTFQDRFSPELVRVLTPPHGQLPANAQLCLSKGRFSDTVVAIFSKKSNIHTHIKTIKDTWIRDLKRQNILYLIVTGDGDNSIHDNVLSLKVPETRENQPLITLTIFDWLYRHTNAQYVVKINDDCFLDVAKFFNSPHYRKHHYYGRSCRFASIETLRTSHQVESTGLFAQASLDKSPQESTYASGETAYVLSRLAIHELLVAADSAPGRHIVNHSFWEDKLVGDLLTLRNIEPADDNFSVCRRRKPRIEGIAVNMTENAFFPSLSTPNTIIQLKNADEFGFAQTIAKKNELWPKKIWPTYVPPSINQNSNQLELLSDTAKLHRLLSEQILIVTVIRNEILMLPHFLAHHRHLGFNCFVFVDNCSDDGSREYLIGQPDVVLFSSDTDYKFSHYGVAWQQAILGNFCLGKWVLLADADELFVFKHCENRNIQDFTNEIAKNNFDAVTVLMVDMYPERSLDHADFSRQTPFVAAPMFDNPPVIHWHLGSGMYSNSMSTVSHFRHRVSANSEPHAFVSQKFAFFKYHSGIRLSEGLHYASNLKLSDQVAWFAHFKYHAGFKQKVEIEIQRKQHFNNANEYISYFNMLNENQGSFFKPGISIPFKSSMDFYHASQKPYKIAPLDQNPET